MKRVPCVVTTSQYLTVTFYVSWNHPPPPEEVGGWERGGVYRALGELNFSSTAGGLLSQMGFLKIFTPLGGTTDFSFLGGWGGVSPPLDRNLLTPLPPGKVPPTRLPVPNLDRKCVRLSN